MRFLSVLMLLSSCVASASADAQTKAKEISIRCNALPSLNEIISSGKNNSLSYYYNNELSKGLSCLVFSYLHSEDESQVFLNKIQHIYENEDYRWMAMYLNSIHSKDGLFESMFCNKSYSKEDVFMYYFWKYNEEHPKNVFFVDSVRCV